MTKYLMGGRVDQSIPNIDDLLKDFPTINAEKFKDWLGKSLGCYRLYKEHTGPMLSVEKRELGKYIKALKNIEPYLESPYNLPPITQSILFEVEYPHGLHHDTIEIYHTLLRKRLLAEKALETLEKRFPPSEGGRKPKTGRDQLLNRIVGKLNVEPRTKTKATEVAAEILERAGVGVPEDESDIRAARDKGGG